MKKLSDEYDELEQAHNTTYGEFKDVYKRQDQWLVDPEAAEVVKRIFAMTIEGYGPYQIARKLKSEKVLIPVSYTHLYGRKIKLSSACSSSYLSVSSLKKR